MKDRYYLLSFFRAISVRYCINKSPSSLSKTIPTAHGSLFDTHQPSDAALQDLFRNLQQDSRFIDDIVDVLKKLTSFGVYG